MEVDDIITNIRQGTQQPNIMIADKAIEPIGESKSDFEAVIEVAKRFELEYSSPRSLRFRYAKKVWGYMGGEKLVPWEQLKEKKYWIYHG
jgi:anaerobic selenocysteine-containing dehydrogenase